MQPIQNVPQTPIISSKNMSGGSVFPVSPSEMPGKGNHSNRHMIASMLRN